MEYLKYIKKIFKLLDTRTKLFVTLYCFLMVLLIFLETIGLGALSIYIGLISDETFTQKLPKFINLYFENKNYETIIYHSSFLIIFLFIFKNSIILFNAWFSLRLKQLILVNNSKKVFNNIMELNYLDFYKLNNSKITYKIYNEVKRVGAFIFAYLHILKEFILIVMLILPLLIINFKISIIAMLFLLLIISLFIKLTNNKLKTTARKINKSSSFMLLSIREIVDNYILIKLSNKYNFFLNKYMNQLNLQIKNSNIKRIIQVSPRILFETLAVAIIVSTCLIMFNLNMELMNFLPILSFLVLITIRLIPSISNLNVNINEMLFNEDSFNVFIQNKISDINNVNKITTIETSNNYYKDLEIELNNISFRYQDNPRYILKDLDIIFKENNIIGLTGSSGSGKSTLVKLIMGFLKPDKGNVLINKKRLFFDDLDWQSQIGYMPQRILLTNSFLRNNIAMGEDDNEINDNKILKILDNIYFKKIIDYEKFSKIKIYEDGSNLSGGQIQLVGLARALYNDQKIIILDEPTNNLDFKLKEIFMKFLYEIKRKKIIIVISHDKEILKMCDKSYILRNSKLDKFEAHLN